jgi:hypothetical protein
MYGHRIAVQLTTTHLALCAMFELMITVCRCVSCLQFTGTLPEYIASLPRLTGEQVCGLSQATCHATKAILLQPCVVLLLLAAECSVHLAVTGSVADGRAEVQQRRHV